MSRFLGSAPHQHDLRPEHAARLAELSGVGPDDEILEPGAGTGSLTAALLERGARVRAVEIDVERAATLRRRFAAELADGRLAVLVGDARQLLPRLRPAWRVVANPPFVHSAELLRRLLLEDLPDGPPAAIHLLLQRQAVQKCSAADGRQTRSSVLCSLFGSPREAAELPRDAVRPRSHVPLALLALPRADDAPPSAELALVDRLLEVGFAGPHSVRAALRGLATGPILMRQGREHGWDPDAHPRLVPPAAWLALARFLRDIGRL